MDLKEKLDQLYLKFNTRDHVYSDPIEALYVYDRVKDREIAAFITACLAYGRVVQIKKSVANVLQIMGPSPHAFLLAASNTELKKKYQGFVHRFAKTDQLVGLLWALKQVILEYGSLQDCMMQGLTGDCDTIITALNCFTKEIIRFAPHDPGHLVPLTDRGSAGKRLHLFLRWMVRKDGVDPGGWEGIGPAKLIVPVDVHMHRICTQLNFTKRKQANLKTALEITACFKTISPHDPVKYDFALTRLGIEKIDHKAWNLVSKSEIKCKKP